MKVEVCAPGKLMLTGSYAVVHGRPCVVTAVDQWMTVSAETCEQPHFYLDAPDFALANYSQALARLGQGEVPKPVKFTEIMLKTFLDRYPQAGGLKVKTASQFSSEFGFGSSSAVTVALARALVELYDVHLTYQQLFDLCYRAVIKVQGVGSGFDIASAIWGGTIKYVVPAKVIEAIKVDNLPIVVGYTGIKADTPTLVKQVDQLLERQPARINPLFDQIGQTAEVTQRSLIACDWSELGKTFTQHHQLVSQLGVSCGELDKLVSAVLKAGAYGATLSGAGGGDCMLAVVETKSRLAVEKAITQAGGQVIKLGLNAPGTQVKK